MTQEELTTIVQQVVAALLTNGKTIAQLTAVTNVGDSDCFELSGGKKVAFSTLAGLIINEVENLTNYTVVDYDGRDEVTTFTYTKSSGVITMKQEGRNAKTITIATATTSRPGLMSAADKTSLNAAANKVISSMTYTQSTPYAMVLTLNFADNTNSSVTLPVATTSYAGLMSAYDKADLATAKTTATNLNEKLGAVNGIATLDSNGRLSETQIPLNKADLVSGAGVLDIEEWPTLMLYNIDQSADLTAAEPGDIIFVSRQQGNVNVKRLYYITNNNDSVLLGVPNPNVFYCHRSTGLMYKWDTENAVFARIGIDIAGNNRMASSQATPQVMKSMGSTLDNAGNNSNQQVYVSLNVGDTYFDPSEGKIFYKKSSSVEVDLGAPSKLLIYANAQSNKMYRWSGSDFVELG